MNIPEIISQTANRIIELTNPEMVYLYNLKTGISSQVTSFKLCLIADCEKSEIERRIYLNVDCDIPYDVLIYTGLEWDALSGDPQSFAHKIKHTGRLLYEKTGR